MNIQSRAKRILRRLNSYRPIEDVLDEFQALQDQARLYGAHPIGVYLNDGGIEGNEALLISDLGIFVETGGRYLFVAYKNVRRVSIVAGDSILEDDPSKKMEADGLLITMADATPTLIPVRNGKGKYRDVFEFSRFMNRAVEDIKAAQLQSV